MNHILTHLCSANISVLCSVTTPLSTQHDRMSPSSVIHSEVSFCTPSLPPYTYRDILETETYNRIVCRCQHSQHLHPDNAMLLPDTSRGALPRPSAVATSREDSLRGSGGSFAAPPVEAPTALLAISNRKEIRSRQARTP